ncbi:MAG: ribonucleoside-triphosphate reductase [Aquificae bacterium]|nr:ribonucleoside-triphosphate reductase [Aquificota bacterium]
MEKVKETLLELVDEYLKKADLARHNANLVYSLPALSNLLSGEVMKAYMLERVLDEEERLLHEEGWWYQHQLSQLSPYCIGFSATDVALRGLSSESAVMPRSKPPKRLSTLLDQCANFICLISQEVSGAVALNDLITVAASYLWYEEFVEGKKYAQEELVRFFESFLYNINLPFRSGNSPFTNVTLEFSRPAPALKDQPVVVGGKVLSTTYGSIPKEYYERTALAFLKALWEGDADGKPWTFPLVTVPVDDGFEFDNPVFEAFLKNLDKHGGAYFENFMSKPFVEAGLEPRDPSLRRSFCCRFQVDLGELLKVSNTGSIFGNASGVGSVGVISINFNRLGWLFRGDEEGLFKHLEYLLEKARSVLNKKRAFIEEHRELYPTFFHYVKDLSTLFNTISLQGGHEGLINFGFVKRDGRGEVIEEESGLFHPEGLKFARKVSEFILRKLEEFMLRDGVPWNFEYAPGETAGPRLALKDLELFRARVEGRDEAFKLFRELLERADRPPFVKGSPEGSGVFLTAGFQPPFDNPSLNRQLSVSAVTQQFATGGSVQHIFLNEKPSAEALKSFIKRLFSSRPIIYVTLTPTLSVCNACGARVVGEHFRCPYCSSEDTTVYSRVIGYYRPVARKIKKADRNACVYEGEENYWQGGRRADWVLRKKVSVEELMEANRWD